MANYCVDFDDFYDDTVDKLDILAQVKAEHPKFKVTLFAIPMRTSAQAVDRVNKLNMEYDSPWIALAPHGWRHTRGECLSWTREETKDKLEHARRRGLTAPAFRAPGWLLDGETYAACKELGIVVATHATFRIPGTDAKEYVYNDKETNDVACVHGHLTPVTEHQIDTMDLTFAPGSRFYFVHELGLNYGTKKVVACAS